MRKHLAYAATFAAAALFGPQLASQQSKIDDTNRKLASYGLPAIDTPHQQRANCHNSYDLLFAENAKGKKISDTEANWAETYEAARDAKQPCPKPPASLLARANQHVIETQPGLAAISAYVAHQKDPVAMFETGIAMWNNKFGTKDGQEGYDLISLAADLGDVHATFFKGVLLSTGKIDNKKDMPGALVLIQKAANAGHVDAMFNMGIFHNNGLGTKKDPKKSFEWFRKAAERGHIYSTFMAWSMLSEGTGTKKDYDLAYRLGRRLAEDGQVYGAVMAASALLQKSDVMKHQDEILYWMDYSIKYGNSDVRTQMSPLKTKVVDIFKRANAPPAYRPRVFKACGMKTYCTVNHYSGVQSCTTNKDYWSDCDG